MKSALIKFISIVFFSVIAHWILVNAYVYFCAPLTFMGALKTFFSLGSPVCQFMNLIQFELAKNYVTIWATAGVAVVAYGLAKLK
tara:strand:- start:29 stop:283 length:255 start_codon:yes stop_codon:yes gene_type:complete